MTVVADGVHYDSASDLVNDCIAAEWDRLHQSGGPLAGSPFLARILSTWLGLAIDGVLLDRDGALTVDVGDADDVFAVAASFTGCRSTSSGCRVVLAPSRSVGASALPLAVDDPSPSM